LLSHCRLFLTRIERKYECDLYLADLTEFGLTLQSRAPALPNQAGLHLIPDMDCGVDQETIQQEDGITWRYSVHRFVKK